MTTREMTNTTPTVITAGDDEPAAPRHLTSDDFFGNAMQCAADAAFIKRLSLIVVPILIVLCLLTLALT